MGIQVTNQNVNQVLSKFESFASDGSAGLGKGAVAYLFPGLRNSHLESIKKPIFASRSFWRNSSLFRSEDDKSVNNYVRHVFLTAIATKLKCEISDLPRVFEWAGKLKDLKVNDFKADGRPLTARRIGVILEDVKAIELQMLTAVDRYKGLHEGKKLPSYYANVGTYSKHKVNQARQNALPQLEARYVKNYVPTAAILEDKQSDNYVLGREQLTEHHAQDVGAMSLKLETRNLDEVKSLIKKYERELKAGKKDSGNKLSPLDKDFRKTQIKIMEHLVNENKTTMWTMTSYPSNLDTKLARELGGGAGAQGDDSEPEVDSIY